MTIYIIHEFAEGHWIPTSYHRTMESVAIHLQGRGFIRSHRNSDWCWERTVERHLRFAKVFTTSLQG